MLSNFTLPLPQLSLWASFALADIRTGEVFFAGYCDAGAVLSGAVWQQHSGFVRYAAQIGDKAAQSAAVVVSVSIFDSGRDAYLTAAQTKEANALPDAMFVAGVAPNTRGAVRCIETGDIFPNASAAAQWIGCAPPAMSNHLNRRIGHGTIKGHRFERV